MYGSPKVAAPIATARTKSRRLNLPSRRPLQHAQEASRRTTCNVVIVPLLAWSHIELRGIMSVHANTTHVQVTKVRNSFRRGERDRAQRDQVSARYSTPR